MNSIENLDHSKKNIIKGLSNNNINFNNNTNYCKTNSKVDSISMFAPISNTKILPISTSFARKDINSINKFESSTSKINKNDNFKYYDQTCNNYNKIVIVPEDDSDENSEIISNVYNEFEDSILHNNKYVKYENERKLFSKNVEEFINKFNYYHDSNKYIHENDQISLQEYECDDEFMSEALKKRTLQNIEYDFEANF